MISYGAGQRERERQSSSQSHSLFYSFRGGTQSVVPINAKSKRGEKEKNKKSYLRSPPALLILRRGPVTPPPSPQLMTLILTRRQNRAQVRQSTGTHHRHTEGTNSLAELNQSTEEERECSDLTAGAEFSGRTSVTAPDTRDTRPGVEAGTDWD